MAKFWELTQVMSGDDTHFEAELYEQPVPCYLAGRLAYAIWELIGPPLERWMPWCGRRTRFNADETVSMGWQINYELWSSWEAQRWQRRSIEHVRVNDRDPENWWRKGCDLPAPPAP